MKIKVKLFDKLYPEQKSIVDDVFSGKYSFVTTKSGRQAGKSFTLDRVAIGLCLRKSNKELLWITPTHGQSLDAMNRIESILNEKIDYKANHSPSDRRITFDNGSRILFLSAERYDNLRGKHPDFVILDEFAFFKQGAWELAIKPYFIANVNLVAIIASTPTGKNAFYDLWQRGEQHEDGYVNHKLHYTLNPQTNYKFIEKEKNSLPKDVFNQEYEGLFIFGSSAVFGDFIHVQGVKVYQPFRIGYTYSAGLDISGDGEDKTILTIIENETGIIVLVYEVLSSSHPDQARELLPILRSYPNLCLLAEKNGLGNSLCDLLLEEGINLIKWVTTNESKQKLVSNCIEEINNKTVVLPTVDLCPELDNEMSMYLATRTKTSKINYCHPAGLHDDYVDSLMFCLYCRKQYGCDQSVSVSIPHYNVHNNVKYKA